MNDSGLPRDPDDSRDHDGSENGPNPDKDHSGKDQFEEILKMLGIDPSSPGATFQFNSLQEVLNRMFSVPASDSDQPTLDWDATMRMVKKFLSTSKDPTPTNEQRREVADAGRLAEQWLDDAISFSSLGLPVTCWNQIEWIDKSALVWKSIVDPIVDGLAAASEQLVSLSMEDVPAEFGNFQAFLNPFLRSALSNVYSTMIAGALTKLAQVTLTGAEVGFQVLDKPQVGLLPTNTEAFAEGLDIAYQDLLIYLLIRESARQRLFYSVGWLSPQILALVQHFASESRIDPEAIQQSVAGLDPTSLSQDELAEAAQKVQGSIFQPSRTQEQVAILERLETLFALIEGWVHEVTNRVAVKWMPKAPALAELIRRRRATETSLNTVLADLIGLDLKPRKVRDAENLWAALTEARGPEGRDQVWQHPDLMPSSEDLDDPLGFVQEKKPDTFDAFDAELTKLLEQERNPEE